MRPAARATEPASTRGPAPRDLAAWPPATARTFTPVAARAPGICPCGGGCDACNVSEPAALERAAQATSSAIVSGRPAPAVSPIAPDPSTRQLGQAAIARLDGRGRPLPSALVSRFAPALGRAVSSVRIHTGAEASALADAAAARAFTAGQHIVFGAGRYQPDTPGGQRLIAHELAHVVQQERSGPMLQRDALGPPMRVGQLWDLLGGQDLPERAIRAVIHHVTPRMTAAQALLTTRRAAVLANMQPPDYVRAGLLFQFVDRWFEDITRHRIIPSDAPWSMVHPLDVAALVRGPVRDCANGMLNPAMQARRGYLGRLANDAARRMAGAQPQLALLARGRPMEPSRGYRGVAASLHQFRRDHIAGLRPRIARLPASVRGVAETLLRWYDSFLEGLVFVAMLVIGFVSGIGLELLNLINLPHLLEGLFNLALLLGGAVSWLFSGLASPLSDTASRLHRRDSEYLGNAFGAMGDAMRTWRAEFEAADGDVKAALAGEILGRLLVIAYTLGLSGGANAAPRSGSLMARVSVGAEGTLALEQVNAVAIPALAAPRPGPFIVMSEAANGGGGGHVPDDAERPPTVEEVRAPPTAQERLFDEMMAEANQRWSNEQLLEQMLRDEARARRNRTTYAPPAGVEVLDDVELPGGRGRAMRVRTSSGNIATRIRRSDSGLSIAVIHEPDGTLQSLTVRLTRAALGRGTHVTRAARAEAVAMGAVTDDTGHVVGRRLGGPADMVRGATFPQNARINRGVFRMFEARLAQLLRDTSAIDSLVYRWEGLYVAGATRPYAYRVKVWVNDTYAELFFTNPP